VPVEAADGESGAGHHPLDARAGDARAAKQRPRGAEDAPAGLLLVLRAVAHAKDDMRVIISLQPVWPSWAAPRMLTPVAGPLIVVFDASCGVCEETVRFLERRAPAGTFRFVGNDEADLPPGVSREQAQETVVVLEGDRQWTQAAAVARLLRELPAWAPLGKLLVLPGVRGVAGVGYRAFARRRHRVSALLGLRACAVPKRPPEG
jgi:predicted DCC family thiol-disulfide oxidoreductase YuxK